MVTREEREEREGQDKDRALRGTNRKKKKKEVQTVRYKISYMDIIYNRKYSQYFIIIIKAV